MNKLIHIMGPKEVELSEKKARLLVYKQKLDAQKKF